MTVRHPVETEQARWRRTREIIDRCAPGEYEDGNYFAMLAREAASVEMYLDTTDHDLELGTAAKRVLFGTTGHPASHASSRPIGDSVVILMSAGMMYFLYQAAKSVVLSWKPTSAPDGSLTAFSPRSEDTRQVLDENRTRSST